MNHFQVREGELYCEDVPLAKIAADVGTPAYVYSHATLERHFRVFDAAFNCIERVFDVVGCPVHHREHVGALEAAEVREHVGEALAVAAGVAQLGEARSPAVVGDDQREPLRPREGRRSTRKPTHHRQGDSPKPRSGAAQSHWVLRGVRAKGESQFAVLTM